MCSAKRPGSAPPALQQLFEGEFQTVATCTFRGPGSTCTDPANGRSQPWYPSGAAAAPAGSVFDEPVILTCPRSTDVRRTTLVERRWICESRGAAKATVRAASGGGPEAVRPGPRCAGGASAPAGQHTPALDDPGRGRQQPQRKVRLPPQHPSVQDVRSVYSALGVQP